MHKHGNYLRCILCDRVILGVYDQYHLLRVHDLAIGQHLTHMFYIEAIRFTSKDMWR